MECALAELREIHDRAQRAPDQALDFLGASRLLAARRLPVTACIGRARQHAVLGGNPAPRRALQVRRLSLEQARGAEHPRVAEFDQHRAFRVACVTAREAHRTHLVRLSSAGSHATPWLCYRSRSKSLNSKW